MREGGGAGDILGGREGILPGIYWEGGNIYPGYINWEGGNITREEFSPGLELGNNCIYYNYVKLKMFGRRENSRDFFGEKTYPP